MRTIFLVALLLLNCIFAQECLIDGKSMYSIGSSEIVNGEMLALFRCDDGHQMWLSNYDEETPKKNVLQEANIVSHSEPTVTSGTVSLLASVIESEDIALTIEDRPVSVPMIKKETVLKIGSASANYTSDISIKKFGVETLLHKKIESDRVFAESIEEEKNELLHILSAQKKLFDIVDDSKFRFHPFDNPIKFSIYTALSVILISSL